MIDFNKIEAIRIKKGWTKKRFVAMLNMARPTYDGLIEGNDLKVSTFIKICEVLKISPWEVWKGARPDELKAEPAVEDTAKPEYRNDSQIEILMDSLRTKNELIERLKEENAALKMQISGSKTKQKS